MKNIQKILKLFEGKSHVTLIWYWEPFHRTGMSALAHSQNHIEDVLQNLSVVKTPPVARIRVTQKLVNHEFFYPIEISELKKILINWEPILKKNGDVLFLKTIWGQKPEIFERFTKLCPWDQLELIECLLGMTKSQTTLEFQRIDGKA